MSTKHSAVWPKAHLVDDGRDGRRYEITGLWTGSVPGFVDGCPDGPVGIERRGDRTFVVLD